jgi:hypothetical protein
LAAGEVDLTFTPYEVGHLPMNSMVIRGSEPVIVDTGAPANREAWPTSSSGWRRLDPMFSP